MVLPRWLESRSCPIALSDVITALLDARLVPLERSQWFDIPGPDIVSARRGTQPGVRGWVARQEARLVSRVRRT